MKYVGVLMAISLMITIAGCSSDDTQTKDVELSSYTKSIPMVESSSVNNAAEYHKISAEEAKTIMDENSNVIILDVRTEAEFIEKHIENAVLLPDNEIAEQAVVILPNKDDIILIYCRSGNRSRTAANKLVEMGYTNIYDFGGINSYPYDTVSN